MAQHTYEYNDIMFIEITYALFFVYSLTSSSCSAVSIEYHKKLYISLIMKNNGK